MNYSEQEKIAHQKYNRKVFSQKPEQKKKNRDYQRKYRELHPDIVKETNKRCYYKYKSSRQENAKQFQKKPCRDPILQDTVTYNCLLLRIRNHPDIYGDIKAKDYLIHIPKIKGLELLSEQQKEELNV